jgi:CheY-like chemotaxis protein
MNKSTSIVIMENNQKDRQALSSILQSLGYVTKEAQSTAEAWLHAKNGELAFILDIKLPREKYGNPGLVALGRIRKSYPRAFIGVYSDYVKENGQVAYELGADIVIEKNNPVRDATLFVNALRMRHHPSTASPRTILTWSIGFLRSIQAHFAYDQLRRWWE